uniref:(northern house mosquito) hypothetical protein n=1 Tax=Culex pipiens TaxID=7175 RepID=A0A8D8BWJ2_CULPI
MKMSAVAARSGERTKRCRASNLAWPATSGSRRSTPGPNQRTRTGRSSSRAERIPPKHSTSASRTTPGPSCWCSCSPASGTWSFRSCSSPSRAARRTSICNPS